MLHSDVTHIQSIRRDSKSHSQSIKDVDLTPDLVVVDISLGVGSGIDLVKAIKARHEDLPVLVVSMHDESLYAERALRSGAMGYVMKHERGKKVLEAISRVLGGDVYLSEKMSRCFQN
jgi:DNA-binding NarL/FixJ family response regulator